MLRAAWVLPPAALLLAVYFLYCWQRVSSWASFDTYQYFYPNMLYAARAFASGGRGFFWNAMQACGEPFFSISSTGTLYPLHWLFYVLDADLALRAVIVLDLAIGGVGTYLLCRELGLDRLPAVCGAMCFEIGNATIDLASWMPLAVAPFVWMPAALLCCERILRAPSTGHGVLLGLTLTMAMLSGYPQGILFIYQLVGLRVLWHFASGRSERRLAAIGAIALGLTLPLLLAAVTLLPSIESGRDSVRGIGLTRGEILAEPNVFKWKYFRKAFDRRSDIFNPFLIVPAAVALASVVGDTLRRPLFYLAAGGLYFVLAFGDSTPLFDYYLSLPIGKLFREPARFLWVCTFCMAVLSAAGTQALIGRRAGGGIGRRRGALALFAAAALGLLVLAPSGLRAGDWILLGVAGAGALSGIVWPGRRAIAAGAVAAAIGINVIAFPLPGISDWALRPAPLRALIPDGQAIWTHQRQFEELRGRMSAQDRVYLVHPHPGVKFMPKTGSLFDVPAIQDYEPQPSLRFAKYFVMMRRGQEMKRVTEYYNTLDYTMQPGFQRRMLDLAAGKFILAELRADNVRKMLQPPPHWIGFGLVRMYENPQALARARFVPRVVVVSDPSEVLRRLARGPDDLRQVALIEAPMPSGFAGSAAASGTVDFEVNEPEHLVLRVRANERGFLHLADQYAPGWSATVNGSAVAIARANYLFRLVEVPAGESVVEFRYAPWSVRIGAAVSTLTAVALIVWGLRSRQRRYASAGATRA